jgi:hypothetical protein
MDTRTGTTMNGSVSNHLTLIEHLSVLGEEAHRASFEAGWWHDPVTGALRERNKGEMMMLMVSELAEMHAGVRSPRPDDHLPHYGLAAVEAADFLIRIGDFVHGFGFDLGAKAHEWPEKDARAHTGIVGAMCAVSDAMEADRKGSLPMCAAQLARAALIVIEFATGFLSLDREKLFAIAHEKIAYNRQRADHKRENRAQAGGKKY